MAKRKRCLQLHAFQPKTVSLQECRHCCAPPMSHIDRFDLTVASAEFPFPVWVYRCPGLTAGGLALYLTGSRMPGAPRPRQIEDALDRVGWLNQLYGWAIRVDWTDRGWAPPPGATLILDPTEIDIAPPRRRCPHPGAAGPCMPRSTDGRCVWCEGTVSAERLREATPAVERFEKSGPPRGPCGMAYHAHDCACDGMGGQR